MASPDDFDADLEDFDADLKKPEPWRAPGVMGKPASTESLAQVKSEQGDYDTIQDVLRGARKAPLLSFDSEIRGGVAALRDKIARAFGGEKAPGDAYADTKAKNDAQNAAAAKRSPTGFVAGELGGSLLTPLPFKGRGILKTGANAATLAAADTLGDAEHIDGEALKNAGKAGTIGLGLGLGLGGIAKGAGALAGAGAKLASKAEGKIAAEVAAKKAESIASTLGKVGAANREAHTADDALQKALMDPRIKEEIKKAITEKLASEDAAFLANRKASNYLDKYGQLIPKLEGAELEHATNLAHWADGGETQMANLIENRSNMWDALWRAGKPIAGMVAGGLGGELLGGHGYALAGGGLGGALGAIHGKPATILGNAARQPGFQKALGRAMESGGKAVSNALETPATQLAGATGNDKKAATANQLQRYLELLEAEPQP